MPLSNRARLERAADLYEQFSGHDAKEVEKVKVNWPRVGLNVGQCDGVLYTTVRDGKTEHYIHKFKARSRPALVVSSDGRQLALVGGAYVFTERGIEDR